MKMVINELERVKFECEIRRGYKTTQSYESLMLFDSGAGGHTLAGDNIHKDLGCLTTDEMLEWFSSRLGKSIEITVDTTVSDASPTR